MERESLKLVGGAAQQLAGVTISSKKSDDVNTPPRGSGQRIAAARAFKARKNQAMQNTLAASMRAISALDLL